MKLPIGLILLALAGASLAQTSADDPFSACDRQVAERPSYETFSCYLLTGERTGQLAAAAQHLEAWRSRWDGPPWPTLVRAQVARLQQQSSEETLDLFREAIAGFQRHREPVGEIIARGGLWEVLVILRKESEADQQLEAAQRLAARSSNEEVQVRWTVLEASNLTTHRRQLGRAQRLLLQARQSPFAQANDRLLESVLRHFSELTYLRGRLDETASAQRQLVDLKRRSGRVGDLALDLSNLTVNLLVQAELRPSPGDRERLVRRVQQDLEMAATSPYRRIVEPRTLALLANLESHDNAEQAAEHYGECLRTARALEFRWLEIECLYSRGRFLAPYHPERSRQDLERAVALSNATEDKSYESWIWEARLRSAFDLFPFDQAKKLAHTALDSIESVRAAQNQAGARIDAIAMWADDYYFLAGNLLERSPEPLIGDAFEVLERLRSRTLLEALDVAEIERDEPLDAVDTKALETVRHRIAATQREMRTAAGDHSRSPGREEGSLERQLEALLLEEARLTEARGALFARVDPPIASVEQVESHLLPHEAMVAFAVGLDENLYGRFGGGSWAFILQHDGAQVVRLPDRMALESKVPIYVGLLEGEHGGSPREAEERASVALHRELLSPVLERLSPETHHLILIPDGILHRLPFAALRAQATGSPLGVRYALSIAPSASLWLRWRTQAHLPKAPSALVLADAAGGGTPALSRGPGNDGLELGALPFARQEGRAACRALGPACTLLTGSRVTESYLKTTALAPYSMLHFATHAVAETEFPDLSAVILNPGSADEDGLLQAREVGTLDLRGKAVVLSACQTAEGEIAAGEGVLNLARSFFAAGADTVVASRWRLEDKATRDLVGWLYTEIARGTPLAESLRLARQEAVRRGMPASTWSGLDLYGDGELRLEPAPRASRSWIVPALLAVLVILVTGSLALVFARRRRLSLGG